VRQIEAFSDCSLHTNAPLMEEGKLNTLLLEGMPFVLREVCGIGKKDEAGAAAASPAARGRGRKPPAKRVKKNEEADNEDIDDSESKKLQDLIDAEHEHEKEEKKDLKRLEALIASLQPAVGKTSAPWSLTYLPKTVTYLLTYC